MNKILSLFRGRAQEPLRLYQLHEHLALLDTGVTRFDPPPSLREACLHAARAIWPLTGLDPWDAFERKAGHCYACGDQAHGYLHVDADHDNCFVIIIFEVKSARPVGWLLFDISAEYREVIYTCPAINYEDEATLAVIEESVPRLLSHRDPYAILDLGGTYMQALQKGDDAYELEHQLVTTACHYRAAGTLTAAQVIGAFKSYAFGKKEWAREIKWEKMDL
ncbi:MAG TPA: hypothetical protein VGN52_26115 [Burkholderiales bacterium]|jgi:hypothetical protein